MQENIDKISHLEATLCKHLQQIHSGAGLHIDMQMLNKIYVTVKIIITTILKITTVPLTELHPCTLTKF